MQVSLSANGERIQFNPCYFEPLSPQIIRNHPITDPEWDQVRPLNYYSEEDSEEDTEEDTEEDMEEDTEDSGSESSDDIARGSSIDIRDIDRAEIITEHLYGHLDASSREGLLPFHQTLWDFSPFERG